MVGPIKPPRSESRRFQLPASTDLHLPACSLNNSPESSARIVFALGRGPKSATAVGRIHCMPEEPSLVARADYPHRRASVDRPGIFVVEEVLLRALTI